MERSGRRSGTGGEKRRWKCRVNESGSNECKDGRRRRMRRMRRRGRRGRGGRRRRRSEGRQGPEEGAKRKEERAVRSQGRNESRNDGQTGGKGRSILPVTSCCANARVRDERLRSCKEASHLIFFSPFPFPFPFPLPYSFYFTIPFFVPVSRVQLTLIPPPPSNDEYSYGGRREEETPRSSCVPPVDGGRERRRPTVTHKVAFRLSRHKGSAVYSRQV